MSLEVIQWQWDLSQNPFQSIASYYPVLRQLKTTRNVSWHTADNTVSSPMASRGAGAWGWALAGARVAWVLRT